MTIDEALDTLKDNAQQQRDTDEEALQAVLDGVADLRMSIINHRVRIRELTDKIEEMRQAGTMPNDPDTFRVRIEASSMDKSLRIDKIISKHLVRDVLDARFGHTGNPIERELVSSMMELFAEVVSAEWTR